LDIHRKCQRTAANCHRPASAPPLTGPLEYPLPPLQPNPDPPTDTLARVEIPESTFQPAADVPEKYLRHKPVPSSGSFSESQDGLLPRLRLLPHLPKLDSDVP